MDYLLCVKVNPDEIKLQAYIYLVKILIIVDGDSFARVKTRRMNLLESLSSIDSPSPSPPLQ